MLSESGYRAPVGDPAVDGLLLQCARSVAQDLPSLLSIAASCMAADEVRCWFITANGAECEAAFPPEAAAAELPPEAVAVLDRQRTVLRTAPQASALYAGIWHDSVLAGVLECVCRSAHGWQDSHRVALAGIADRIGLMRDISGTADALRASEEAYRTIFDSSNDAIFVHDLETGAVLDANRIACEMNGVSLDELKTRGIDLIGAGPAPFVTERALAYLAAAAAGEPQRFEWCTYHRQTGEEMWVEVSLQRVTILGQDRLLALVRDIRERKRAEQALVASEEAYRTIFQLSSEAIWVHDAETGAMIDVNEAGCQMYGYSHDEMLRLGHAALLFPGTAYTAERVGEVMAAARAGESPRFEWMGLHKDGSATWGEVTLRRVTISGRDRILATVRDIRARKAAEEDRNRAEEALRRANDALEQRVAERTAELAATNLALEEEVAEHEAARELLLERTSELEGVFRALPDLYFRTAADGTVLDYRTGDSTRLALSPDQFLGRRLQDVLPPDIGTSVGTALDRLALTGTLIHFEYLMEMPHGATDFEARFVPLGTDQVIIVVRDITERKDAERALRRSEEHFRALIENAHDITSIVDREGRLLYTTPAFTRVLGWSADELLGQNVFEYYHPDDAVRDLPVLQSIIDNPGTVGRSHHRFRCKDGSYRYLEAFGQTLSPHTAADGIVVNVRDVTEHKLAEDALRQSEEHFRRMIENSSDQLMIVDDTAAITYVGPSVERLLGYTQAEMLGKRPIDLVHPDDVDQVMAVMHDIIAHPGEMRIAQYRIRHRDGSWRVFENAGKTLSPTTAAEGVVANGRDVTERFRAEEALREATAAAEQANRAKSEFLSRMSHELRTPMNSILGFAQVLEGESLPTRQERCVQHILRAGRHLLKLINEVLEISRIEAGGQNLSLEPVRIGAAMQESMALARPLATQAGVDMRYSAAYEAEFVHADRQRLSQVLLNLLSNAIKYNRPGGRVRVTCEVIGTSEFGSGTEGLPRLRVRVADTGVGIAPERQADLFTPFARLGAEDSDIEGTGLGLALSQRLTEAMGGSLSLERSGSDGSVFLLELLLAQSPFDRVEENGGTTRRRGDVTHGDATILYIEDNLANLSLVETILWERPKWQTMPALQGQIGVELAREHLPDLILLDLHLPDIRGEEVLRRLREDARTATIPVVVISADATLSAAERLRAAGAAAFLTKPLDVADFLATLDRMLAGRG